MKTKAEHNKLPWKKEIVEPKEETWILDKNKYLIAATHREYNGNHEANASFIVKVANNYEPMLKLLRKIYKNNGGFRNEIEETFNRLGEIL